MNRDKIARYGINVAGVEMVVEAALTRLRPIVMTAIVACLGRLPPAALSTGIGSGMQCHGLFR